MQEASRSRGFGAGFGTGAIAACFLSTLLFLLVGSLRERKQRDQGLLWKHWANHQGMDIGDNKPPVVALTDFKPRAKTAASEAEAAGGRQHQASAAL